VSYSEQAIDFCCAHDTLVGVLGVPESAASLGVVVVVGGPQYRAGSHRQFVLLCRALAAAGIATLRFDYRGMGDSSGEHRDFSNASADIAAAIDALQRQLPSVTRVCLWGLCDGASAALLYCQDTGDRRVSGLCLLNPWVRSDASLARAQVKHYYGQRLRQKEFWVKLLSGQVAGAALAGLWRNLRAMGASASASARASASASAGPSSPSGPSGASGASGNAFGGDRQRPFQQRMAQAWQGFGGQVLLLLSGDDYTAKEFLEYVAMDKAWAGLLDQAHVLRCDLPQADHTFSNAQARSQVEALTLDWLQSRVAA